jgi:hypothetical protein
VQPTAADTRAAADKMTITLGKAVEGTGDVIERAGGGIAQGLQQMGGTVSDTAKQGAQDIKRQGIEPAAAATGATAESLGQRAHQVILSHFATLKGSENAGCSRCFWRGCYEGVPLKRVSVDWSYLMRYYWSLS